MVNETDRIILSELAKDSRVSYAKLGEAVNLSAPAVHARVKKLEESGVVSNYTIKVNPKGVDKIVCAFIRIGLGAVTCQDISDRLIEIPEIEECHSITGEDCLMAKVRTRSPEDLDHVVVKIKKIPGVTRTVTSIALRTEFERTVI